MEKNLKAKRILFVLSLLITTITFIYTLDDIFSIVFYSFTVILTFIAIFIQKITYSKTSYYANKTKNISFNAESRNRMISKVYSKLCKEFPDAKYLVDTVLIKSNEKVEIDIMMFSSKGVFILQIREWYKISLNPPEFIISPGHNYIIEFLSKLYKTNYYLYPIHSNIFKCKSRYYLNIDEFIKAYKQYEHQDSYYETLECYNMIKNNRETEKQYEYL